MAVFSIRDLSYYFRKWPSFLPSWGFCWQFVIFFFFFFLDIMLTIGKDQPCMCHRLKTGVIVSPGYLVSPFVGSLKSACPSWLRFSPWVSSDLRSDPSSATEEPWDLGRSPWPLLNLSLLKYWWKHLTPWPPRRRMLDPAHKHLLLSVGWALSQCSPLWWMWGKGNGRVLRSDFCFNSVSAWNFTFASLSW